MAKAKRWTEADLERLQKSTGAGTKLATDLKPELEAATEVNASLFGKVTTGSLTLHAIWALSMKGYDVWRQNSVGVWDPKKEVFRKNANTRRGVSDVIGFHRRTGQFAACEIKNGKDKISKEQMEFLETVQRSGGLAMVVRNLDDIEKFMQNGKVHIQ